MPKGTLLAFGFEWVRVFVFITLHCKRCLFFFVFWLSALIKVCEMGIFVPSIVWLLCVDPWILHICLVHFQPTANRNTDEGFKNHTENWFVEVWAPISNTWKSAAKQHWIYEITSDEGSNFVNVIVHKCTTLTEFSINQHFQLHSHVDFLQERVQSFPAWLPSYCASDKCSELAICKNINHHSAPAVDNSPGRACEQQPPSLPMSLLPLQNCHCLDKNNNVGVTLLIYWGDPGVKTT